MQRDIVASDFGFDFVADSQFVWWGSWSLTSVSFHVAIPKRFAAIDYKRWRREGIGREGVLIPLLWFWCLFWCWCRFWWLGLEVDWVGIGVGWLWFDFHWFPLICCACDFNFETVFWSLVLKFFLDLSLNWFGWTWSALDWIGFDVCFVGMIWSHVIGFEVGFDLDWLVAGAALGTNGEEQFERWDRKRCACMNVKAESWVARSKISTVSHPKLALCPKTSS